MYIYAIEQANKEHLFACFRIKRRLTGARLYPPVLKWHKDL